MTDTFGAWELPEELRLLQETARRFMAEEVEPVEAQLPHDAYAAPDHLLQPLIAKAKALGIWAIRTPPEYGGAGLNMLGQVVLVEETAKCRMGQYVYAAGALGTEPPEIIWKGTAEQIARWAVPTIEGKRKGFFAMSEPSGGSDPARALRTRAVRDGDGYVLNGSKTWITGAGRCDWGIVFARTGDAGDRGGITAFIVDSDTPGISFNEIGVIRSYTPFDVYLSDCRIPAENRIGEEGQGFALGDEFFAEGRILYTASAIGGAQKALDLAIEWAKERETFGSRLADKQAIQWMLADSEMELRAARLLVYQAAWNCDLGKPYKVESSIAKVTGTETALRVVSRCIQIFGGLGVTHAMPLERWFRELRIKQIGEGPSEVQRLVVARHLLGKVRS